MAQLQVILLERVENLGQMGDVVKVKQGYARNFLLPEKKALRATKENVTYFESRRAQLEADNLTKKGEAEAVAGKMDKARIVIVRQAGESGQLYGSVGARDISDGLTAGGYKVEKRQVVIDRPIKMIGIHTVRVVLHPEVSVNVHVNVGQSEDEAKLQAERFDRGESPVVLKTEAEAAEVAAAAAAKAFTAEPAPAPAAEAEEKPAKGKAAKAKAEPEDEEPAKGKGAKAAAKAEAAPAEPEEGGKAKAAGKKEKKKGK
jgi:large subunit ribosomal protein L9